MTEGGVHAAERIGLRIAYLRLKAGWSQPELAARAGLSKATISKLERGVTGNPGVQTLARVAKALGWPDYVVMLESDAPGPPAPSPAPPAPSIDVQAAQAAQSEFLSEMYSLLLGLRRDVRTLVERGTGAGPPPRPAP